MKFSLWPHGSVPATQILDEARWAEAHKWHGVWVADHYMPNTGTAEVAAGPMHEAWALLPALAVVTSSIRVGVLVAPTTVHHPALIANRAATIDHLSNGRFVLGLGAGWQVNEHTAYGFDLRAPKDRVDRFEEAIQIVNSLLTEERTTFAGAHFQLADAPAEPKPIQQKLPILVGTAGPRMLRITARHASEWNTWGAPDVSAPKVAALHNACEKVGRDPLTLHKSVNVMLSLDGAHPAAPERVITGSADYLVDQLSQLKQLGFDELILPSWNLGASLESRLEALETLENTVLNQL